MHRCIIFFSPKFCFIVLFSSKSLSDGVVQQIFYVSLFQFYHFAEG